MSYQQQLDRLKFGLKNNKEQANNQEVPYRPEWSIEEDASIVNELRFSQKTLDRVLFRCLW